MCQGHHVGADEKRLIMSRQLLVRVCCLGAGGFCSALALFKDPTSVVLNSICRHDLSAEWKLAQRATSRAVIARAMVGFTFPISTEFEWADH